jgi:hypothetical protein
MAHSEQVRTYAYIGIAVGTILLAPVLGIVLLTDPAASKGDAWAFFSLVCTGLLAAALLWNRYAQRPRDDPKYWRARADEALAHAERLADPASQRMMLEMASDYEKLAKRAEERQLSTKISS